MRPVVLYKPLVFIVLYCFSAGIVHGHNYLDSPDGENLPVEIPDIEISRAAYRELGPGSRHSYMFSAKADDQIFIQITIPYPNGLDTFRPLFLLALEKPERTGTNLFDLGAGGAAVKNGFVAFPGKLPDDVVRKLEDESLAPLLALEWDGNQTHFDEHFTGTEYWIRQELTLSAPVTGTYTIFVYESTGKDGKYILATGKKESFSFTEILTLPGVRIKVRKFMGKSVLGDYLFWGALAGAVAGGIGYLVFRAVRS